MRTSALVQEAADGGVIIVEKRGENHGGGGIPRTCTQWIHFPKTNGEISRFISEDRIR